MVPAAAASAAKSAGYFAIIAVPHPFMRFSAACRCGASGSGAAAGGDRSALTAVAPTTTRLDGDGFGLRPVEVCGDFIGAIRVHTDEL